MLMMISEFCVRCWDDALNVSALQPVLWERHAPVVGARSDMMVH
jgi:hypothetical protein